MEIARSATMPRLSRTFSHLKMFAFFVPVFLLSLVFCLKLLSVEGKEADVMPRYVSTAEMVKTYFHNSELERRWAFALVGKIPFKGNETVLDIGCRDGKITADISRFLPKGKIHGEDPSEEAILWARKQFHPNEYPNVSFDLGSPAKVSSRDHYDIIFSCCAMQFSKDPVRDLKELKKRLNPGGKIFLTFPAPGNTAWQLATRETRMSPKWSKYWCHFEPSQWYSADRWEEFLQKAGFSVVRSEKIKTMDPFIDKDEWVQWLKGVYPPLIPKQQECEFFNECIDRYLSYDPDAQGQMGVIYAKFGRIEIEAALPDAESIESLSSF